MASFRALVVRLASTRVIASSQQRRRTAFLTFRPADHASAFGVVVASREAAGTANAERVVDSAPLATLRAHARRVVLAASIPALRTLAQRLVSTAKFIAELLNVEIVARHRKPPLVLRRCFIAGFSRVAWPGTHIPCSFLDRSLCADAVRARFR